IHSEVVATAIGAAESAATLCVLLALHAASRGRLSCMAWVALGLTCKETAVLAGPLLGLWLWLRPDEGLDADPQPGAAEARERRARRESPPPRRRALSFAASLAILAAYLWCRASVLSLDGVTATQAGNWANPLVDHGAAERLWTAFDLFWRYQMRCLLGTNLSADYSAFQIPIGASRDWTTTLAGLASLLGWIALAARVHGPTATSVRFAIGMWLGCMALVVHLLTPLPTFFAERLAYLPSVAFALLGGFAGAALAQRVSGPGFRGLRVLAGVYLAWCLVASFLHALAWTSEDRITRVTAEHSPHSARAQLWRARVLLS